jgi:hypothetical protein
MIYNTSFFHFFPGGFGDTHLPLTDRLVTKSKPKELQNIINNSLSDTNNTPERFGMLMHIFADTYSHQDFSGIVSKKNDIENLSYKGLLSFQSGVNKKSIATWLSKIKIINRFIKEKDIDDVLPAYGHSQAYGCPDVPYLDWSFEYSKDRCDTPNNSAKKSVNNSERYIEAFREIAKHILSFLKHNPECIETEPHGMVLFDSILVHVARDSQKIKMWQEYLIENNYYDKNDEAITYDKNIWLKEAIANYTTIDDYEKRKVSGIVLSKNFYTSSLYHFHQSILWYKSEMDTLCKEHNMQLPH